MPSATPDSPLPLPDEARVAETILALAAACAPGRTIDPSDAARALRAAEDWQRALPLVRRAAVRLALEGRLVIYRKGKPIDPAELRGVYRIGLPRED